MKNSITINETILKSILDTFRIDEKFIEEKEDEICYSIIFKECIYTKNFNLLKEINNDFFVSLINNNLYLTIYKH